MHPKTLASTQMRIAIMQAFADGKRVQRRIADSEDFSDWRTDADPEWNWTAYEYRIAPEEVSQSITYRVVLMKSEDGTTARAECLNYGEKLEQSRFIRWLDNGPQTATYIPRNG